MMFVSRDKELAALEREFDRSGSSFVVIYGRRRVGKTTLIKEFLQDKKYIFLLADTQHERIQLERLKIMAAKCFDDTGIEEVFFFQWDGIFNYIYKQRPFKEKLVIVFDEFQYLAKVNDAVPSIFNRIWEEQFKDLNVMWILCGSHVGMMYRTVLNYSSPLYGRRTGQIHLVPLRFRYFSEFFENRSLVRRVELFAVLSGVPKYIETFKDCDSVFSGIRDHILDREGFLYQEPLFILGEELSETATYFTILETISKGTHKIGNIASKLEIPTTHLTSFLKRLMELDLIEREVPVTEVNPSKSKRGLYFIKDHFFRFWFRYVLPYRSALEVGDTGYVMDIIKSTFHLFVSRAFEQVCMDRLLQDRPVEIQKVGRWWNKNEEIDIVTLTDSEVLLGECKWWQEPVGLNVLERLEKKSTQVVEEGQAVYFALFAKSGFTSELKERAKSQKNLFLYDFSEEE
jgi:AAA+ ATPase superfamily predicted ATPase